MAKDRIPLDEYRRFITARVSEQHHGFIPRKGEGNLHVRHPSGMPIAGHKLAAAKPFIDQIQEADEDTGRKITGWFATLPMYSVLELLTNPNQPLLATHQEQIEGIVEAATGLEYRQAKGMKDQF